MYLVTIYISSYALKNNYVLVTFKQLDIHIYSYNEIIYVTWFWMPTKLTQLLFQEMPILSIKVIMVLSC